MQYTGLIFTRKERDILSVESTDPIKYQLINIYVYEIVFFQWISCV